VQREPETIEDGEDFQALASTRHRLLLFLSDRTPSLYGTIRSYVVRLGLAPGADAQSVALEVMQQMVIEALGHASSFETDRQPMAWLLGIALNVIRRRRTEEARRSQREVSLGRLSLLHPEIESESELLDSIYHVAESGPEQLVESDEQARTLLSLVPEKDQEILRLAFLEDFDREALADRLGTTNCTHRYGISCGRSTSIHRRWSRAISKLSQVS
jgi:DNA-directed RNA polymerase specialized sigma24 family protein